MEKAEESAAEAEAEGGRGLRGERQRRVVELELLQAGAQVLEVLGVDGVDAREDHGLDFLEAGDGLLARLLHVRDGVAHFALLARLDAGDDVADVACRQLLARLHLQLEHAHLVGVVLLAGGEELHEIVLGNGAVENLEIGDDAAEGVEDGIED